MKIIEADDLVALGEKPRGQMGAEKTCSTGDQITHEI
jgi:hypothetical protein